MRRIASIGHGKTLTAGFEYDGRNQLTMVSYPSGRVVEYNRNANGRVTSVVATYNGVATTVASGILYEPFGPPRLMTYGNGLTQGRVLDTAYTVTEVNLLDVATFSFFDSVAYTPDANGNVDAYTDYLTSAKSRDYTHDALDRLTRDSGYTPGSGDTYGYDANGNRLTRTAATQNQGLAYVTGSNRISTYNGSALAYDGMGNLLGRGSVQFAYAASGRLREVNIGSQTWARQVYNGVGELARNRVTADDPCSVDEILLSTDYVLYGPTGQVLHLVTENGAGIAVDYIWLDDLPLAQFETAFDAQGVEQGTPKVTYLHPDHLGTPRIGTNEAQQITWRWEPTEAFGQSLPTGTDIVRLRFPGQMDLQVGMISYNYFRSYDALLGRYLESDPIGLEAGLNTYGYALANPLRYTDVLGLDSFRCERNLRVGRIPIPRIGPLFHQFLCTDTPEGRICRGLGPSSSDVFDTPGILEDDEFRADRCEIVADDNRCVDACLLSAFLNPIPNYSADLSRGENCQTYAGSVLSECLAQCKAK